MYNYEIQRKSENLVIQGRRKKNFAIYLLNLHANIYQKKTTSNHASEEKRKMKSFFFDTGFLCYTSAGYVHCTCKRKLKRGGKILND